VAFKAKLGEVFHCFVKRDWQPEEGERLEDDLLIRPDKNPNTARARELFHDTGEPAFHDGTDLVLVWGEGCDFARLPRGAKVIFLNSYLAPENGHAEVFLPISIQTERNGHYTNFEGTVSEFRACFPKAPGVVDAEALFVALAAPARGHP
jgi:NADH-quinone oxidoreductase subunit G